MDRRDMLKSLGVAAAGAAAATTAAKAQEANTEMNLALEDWSFPWDPQDPEIPGRQNMARVPDNYINPGRFAGKTFIVTGSARGMGADAARRLAREGANVVGVDILEELGAQTVDGIRSEGLSATFVPGDISQDAVCAEMVRVAVETFGGIDGAINNAGVMDALLPDEPIDYVNQKDRVMARIDEAGNDYWRRVMEVNVTGTFYSLRHELRQLMKQERGGTPPYVASKHAVQGLTKNAAIDYAPFGIRVNSVGMATTLTPMFERAFEIINQRRATGFKDTGLGLTRA